MALDRVHRNDHGFSIAIVSSESLMNTIHGQVGTKQPEVVFPLAIYQKKMDFCVFKSRKMSKILPKKMATGPLGLQCPSHLKLFLEPANQMALHHLGAAKVLPEKTNEKRPARTVSSSVCWSIIPFILVIIYSSWL
jgi:hypothetical protein